MCVEFRHPSWLTDDVKSILAPSTTPRCAGRTERGRPLGPLWRTADWGYLRFHEGAARPWPRYGTQSLQSWVTPDRDAFPPEADVFAFFNNDQHGAAPADADALARLPTGRAGRAPRRRPS